MTDEEVKIVDRWFDTTKLVLNMTSDEKIRGRIFVAIKAIAWASRSNLIGTGRYTRDDLTSEELGYGFHAAR